MRALESVLAALPERPLRIVQFAKAFWLGGTEVQVVELIRGLPGSYEVHVAVLENDGPLLPQIRGLGLEPVEFPLRGTVKQLNTARQVAQAAAWLRERGVDLVHAHDFYSAVVAVPAARVAGCKVIVGRLDLVHWHDSNQRRLLRWLTHTAHHVIANAEAIRRLLVEKEGIPDEKISVIRNGLDLASFDVRARGPLEGPLPHTGGAPVLVHVGNMSHPVKRQEDLLTALVEVRRAVPGTQLLLVGDGGRRRLVEGQARALGLASSAHFLGFRRDVPQILRRASVGILCSSSEGLSNAVIEGMAAGVPMVVTAVGGNPELVADGQRGWVVPPCEPAALGRAIIEALQRPEEAARRGAAARAFVSRELGLARMALEHDAVYRRVVEARA